ncbi:hypothetical protein [Chromatium okenii]|jgi:hypothetical protein|uniref:hypothetical protein n=1 Tax=Chromatium okenii TaxID=61644 RepID=UPI0026EF7D61|nr:hypothetical protein [Chromatium okenii]MBV5310907.1 hypothetical protein [Chromatium okenii]
MSDVIASTSTSTSNTLPISTEEMLKALAGEIRENVRVSGSNISTTKNGLFKLPSGEEVEELEGVIVTYRFRNTFYSKPYKAGDFTPPDCWAFGVQNNDTLVPHPHVASAKCSTCGACHNNQFGSSRTGSGKACQNQIWLALMYPDLNVGADIYTLKVSATAIKQVQNHLLRMTERYQHPICTISRFTVDSSSGYNRISVALQGANPLFAQHLNYLDEATRLLEAEPLTQALDTVSTVKDSGRGVRLQ